VKGTKLRDCRKRSGDQAKGSKGYAMLEGKYVRWTEATMQECRASRRAHNLLKFIEMGEVTSIEESNMLYI